MSFILVGIVLSHAVSLSMCIPSNTFPLTLKPKENISFKLQSRRSVWVSSWLISHLFWVTASILCMSRRKWIVCLLLLCSFSAAQTQHLGLFLMSVQKWKRHFPTASSWEPLKSKTSLIIYSIFRWDENAIGSHLEPHLLMREQMS